MVESVLPRASSATLRLSMGLVVAMACARATTPPAPTPPSRLSAPALPPVPLVDGPLAIRIVYPTAGAVIQARDSNFIFGTVGSGRASLLINGAPVPVIPNGSFLAYLAVPPASAPHYTIVASRGADTARATHAVKLLAPRLVLADTGRLVVDSGSVSPRGIRIARPDERIRVSIRAPRNAIVTLRLADSSERRLVNAVRALDSLRVTARGGDSDAYAWATDVPASVLVGGAHVIVARGADTARFPIRDVAIDDPGRPRWVRLTGGAAVPDTDRVVILR